MTPTGRARAAAALAAALIAGETSVAWAWEAPTTHAGLAEQAAQSSALHQRLVAIGFSQGLYESLTIPPQDAPTLIAARSPISRRPTPRITSSTSRPARA